MSEWWGLSLDTTLLVASLLLVLVDIFFASDIPTHIAYVLVSTVIARQADVHILYRASIGVVSWFGLVAFHYLLWRKVLDRISNQWIAPTRYADGAEGLIGSSGRIELIEGQRMIRMLGDLWRFEARGDEPEVGEDAVVVEQRDGLLVVRRKKRG